MSSTKNILIILSGYSTSGIGEQFLEAMLRGYDKKHIWRYSTVITNPNSDNLHPYSTKTKVVPYSKYPVGTLLALKDFKKSYLSPIMEDIDSVVKDNNIDVIWVFMNSWYTIQIAAELAHKNIPYVTHVWDSPEYLAKNLYLPSSTKRRLLDDFSKAMKGANYAVTVSQSMTDIYKERYGSASMPMVFCPPPNSWRTHTLKSSEGAIEIIFAGSLYAYAQWNVFLDAVEWRNKQPEKRKINVTCVGNVSRWAKKRKWVNYLPLQPIEKAATMVNDAHIAYLPYWMDKSHAHFVQTAFPGKMSFYIASGTPVLFHGPEVSTPTDFINKNKIGKTCHTNRKEDIINQLEAILAHEFMARFQDNQERTLDEVFHPDRCVDIFNKVLKDKC